MKTGQFFEINVTKGGLHVFATDSTIRSYSASYVSKLVELFKEKFPKEEGYDITVTTWSCGCPALPSVIKEQLK